MNSSEKRAQILGFADSYGVKRPREMPRDFVTMEYAEGLEDAAEYAYRAAQSIFTAAAEAGKLDSHAKSDLKAVLNVWATFVYAKAQGSEAVASKNLYAIWKEYNGGLKMDNIRSDVQNYLKKTAEGLRAMAEDESCIVGRQNKDFYERAIAVLMASRDYVLSAVEILTPEANDIAKRIVYGADGVSGVAAFRKGVSEKMAPPLTLLEDVMREAMRWSRLNSGNTKKIKKKEELVIDKDDTFSLYAAMPNLGAKLRQFTAAVEANKTKLEKKLDKKRQEHAVVEKELRKMEDKCLEYRKQQLNGEITAVEALSKVKELRRKIETKQNLLDMDEVEDVISAAIESNSELYLAVDYVRQLWDISEAILTAEERYELFQGFPYSAILNVLQGGTEQEELVKTEIYVARDGINRKIEAKRASNGRFEKLWSQAHRTKTNVRKTRSTVSVIDRNKAAEDELNAMFGSTEAARQETAEDAAQEEKKLEDLLV